MKLTPLVTAPLLVLFLAGCDDLLSVAVPDNGGAVAGTIRGASSGLPLDGAIVTLQPGGYADTTDIYGLWVFAGLDTITYSLTVSRTGYNDTTMTLMVSPDSAIIMHLSMVFAPPPAGLVADYTLDGNTVDGSGNGYDGVGYRTTSTEDRFHRANAALRFNGTAYINLGTSPSLNLLTGMTITAWVRDSGGAGIKNVLSRWDMVDDVNERTYGFGLWNGNRTYFILSNDGTDAGAVLIQDPTPLRIDRWYFLAATYDNSVMRMYINGAPVDSGYQTGVRSSPNTRTAIGATIGRSGDPYGAPFRGSIDAVRIYNRPLSPGEIGILYDEK